MSTAVGSLLEAHPGVAGGRLCLAGTGMPVIQVAIHYRSGERPEQVLERFPHLDLARIHAAIAYYLANQDDLDREIAAEEAAFQLAKASSAATHD